MPGMVRALSDRVCRVFLTHAALGGASQIARKCDAANNFDNGSDPADAVSSTGSKELTPLESVCVPNGQVHTFCVNI